jgi:hypothetical protein
MKHILQLLSSILVTGWSMKTPMQLVVCLQCCGALSPPVCRLESMCADLCRACDVEEMHSPLL